MKNYVVYNSCYGGFGLSAQAIDWLVEHHHPIVLELISKERNLIISGYLIADVISRHDSLLVKCVQELGQLASGSYAQLSLHLLKGDQYRIDEYDGNETIIENELHYQWISVS